MTEKMDCRGRWFAVCCVHDSATQILDDFLTANYPDPNGYANLVVVSSLKTKYTDPTRPPVTAFTSPFQGMSATECQTIIYELTADTGSDLNYEFIVLLDERSTQDSTALVAGGTVDKELTSFRAEFGVVGDTLGAMMAKGLGNDFKEDAERAADGVLR